MISDDIYIVIGQTGVHACDIERQAIVLWVGATFWKEWLVHREGEI